MPITSISLFRPKIPCVFLHRHHLLLRHINTAGSLPILAASRQQEQNQEQKPNNVARKPAPNKNLLRAKEFFRDYSTLAPIDRSAYRHKPDLSDSRTIGTVAAQHANFMRVIVPSSGAEPPPSSESHAVELLCVVRAVLKKMNKKVLVGDKVSIGSIDWVERRGMIEDVLARKTEIPVPPVANVDHLVVLFSMDQPKPEPLALTRFLVEAESTGIPLTLALNKSELVDEETLVCWESRLQSWGYQPVFCSVKSEHGIDSLAFLLRDQTTVIVGPSGVGKSSLINVLRNYPSRDASEAENWFDPIPGSKWFKVQRVGEVSTRSGRGKHTTRNVCLLPLSGGGYLADTPGFNQPTLMKVTKNSLAQAFPEIRKLLDANAPAKCLFTDCLHRGEPGCIVEGDWERYPFYLRLLEEIRTREGFELRTYGTKREDSVRYKNLQPEPRLELKKHRRQSRKRINQSIWDEYDELDDMDDEENGLIF